MNKQLMTLCTELEESIKVAYEGGVTLDEAERLASKFLYAQMQLATALQSADLDSRMKKSGLKAIKAAVYLEEVSKSDKKPSDTFLQNVVEINSLVIDAQGLHDKAEVDHDKYQNYFIIFKEAHVHFRGIAKGRFE